MEREPVLCKMRFRRHLKERPLRLADQPLTEISQRLAGLPKPGAQIPTLGRLMTLGISMAAL
jgi:hypothetical protein